MIDLVLLVLAALCFLLAAAGVEVVRKRRFDLVALGLFLAILVPLIDQIDSLA